MQLISQLIRIKVKPINHLWYILLWGLGIIPISAQHSLQKLAPPTNQIDLDESGALYHDQSRSLFFTRTASYDFEKTLLMDSVDVYTTASPEAYEAVLLSVFAEIAERPVPNVATSPFNQDIWKLNLFTNQIDRLPFPINSALPNSIVALWGERADTLVLVNQFGKDGSMSPGFSISATRDFVEYSFPEPIQIEGFELSASAVNLTISPKADYLILSMILPEWGSDRNLFLSRRVGVLQFGPFSPIHSVNTPFDEVTPFWSPDGKTLLFSSNREGQNFDLYACEILDTEPLMLGVPVRLNSVVNSSANEFFPHLHPGSNTLYFTSDRDGSNDIFLAKWMRDEMPTDAITTKIEVRNAKSNTRVPCDIYVQSLETEEILSYVNSPYGQHSYGIKENIRLRFWAENRGETTDTVILDVQHLIEQGNWSPSIILYLDAEKIIIQDQWSPNNPFRFQYEGLLVKENEEIVLDQVYFVQGKDELLPESLPQLRRLTQSLLDESQTKITIYGHTDNVGDLKALIRLSELRAKAIADYLLSRGISSDRIQTIGLGPNQPLNANRNEEERSQNRRVSFSVTKLKKE